MPSKGTAVALECTARKSPFASHTQACSSYQRAAPAEENSMSNPNLFGTSDRAGTIIDQAAYDVGLRQHMLRVYNYMASGLVLSGVVAYGLFASPALASLFFEVEAGRCVGLDVLVCARR